MKAFRIMEVDPAGMPRSLFHSTNGTRSLQLNAWQPAEIKFDVKDGSGGATYTSGFHVFMSLEECIAFFIKHFRNYSNRAICKVDVRLLGKKPLSEMVFLADMMKIEREDWQDRIPCEYLRAKMPEEIKFLSGIN